MQGSGCRVQGSGIRVQGAGFRVQGAGFRVQGSGFRVQSAGFRVQDSGFRVQGSGCRVRGPGCRVQGSGFTHLACRRILPEMVEKGGARWFWRERPRLVEGLGFRFWGLGFSESERVSKRESEGESERVRE